jgi:DNA-binding transcriptional regulator PaaX
MGLIYEILQELNRGSFNYKGVKVGLLGLPKFKSYSQNTFSGSLDYMRKKGLLEYSNDQINITHKGREYVKRKYDSLRQFNFQFDKDTPRNLIVMFDIPETKKAEREWLRWHLKKFNYLMIQKSVWVGPSPLPKEFLEYLESIGIKDGFKTFKLAKGYVFKK